MHFRRDVLLSNLPQPRSTPQIEATAQPQFLTIPVGALNVGTVSGAAGGTVEVPGAKVTWDPGFVCSGGRAVSRFAIVGGMYADRISDG